MVEELSKDFTNISKQLEDGIRVAGDAGDDVSEYMFISMQTSVAVSYTHLTLPTKRIV